MIGLGSHSRKRPHQRAQLRGGLRRKLLARGRYLLRTFASHDLQIGAEGQCRDDTGWTRRYSYLLTGAAHASRV